MHDLRHAINTPQVIYARSLCHCSGQHRFVFVLLVLFSPEAAKILEVLFSIEWVIRTSRKRDFFVSMYMRVWRLRGTPPPPHPWTLNWWQPSLIHTEDSPNSVWRGCLVLKIIRHGSAVQVVGLAHQVPKSYEINRKPGQSGTSCLGCHVNIGRQNRQLPQASTIGHQ